MFNPLTFITYKAEITPATANKINVLMFQFNTEKREVNEAIEQNTTIKNNIVAVDGWDD